LICIEQETLPAFDGPDYSYNETSDYDMVIFVVSEDKPNESFVANAGALN